VNPRALLGIAIVVLVGVGGVIGYFEWQKRNKPPAPVVPPPPPPPPPPPSPEEQAKLDAAKAYEELSTKIKELTPEQKESADTAKLHLTRAQAIYRAEDAIPLPPKERCDIMVSDAYHVLNLKLEIEEAYEAVFQATRWVEALDYKREDKEKWMTRCLATLDVACGENKPAHKARVDYVRWRLKRPWAPEPKPMQERELESLEAMLAAKPDAQVAEEAGDVAKLLGKLNKAMANWRKAIELDPDRKERLEKKIAE
jgi:tetratricopeptide (TPR) repeat protein